MCCAITLSEGMEPGDVIRHENHHVISLGLKCHTCYIQKQYRKDSNCSGVPQRPEEAVGIPIAACHGPFPGIVTHFLVPMAPALLCSSRVRDQLYQAGLAVRMLQPAWWAMLGAVTRASS